MPEPTSPHLAALQELELDDSVDSRSDTFEDVPTTPSANASPTKSPAAGSKVRAAAAMWETGASTSASVSSSSLAPQAASTSPVGSFRSIAPGSSPETKPTGPGGLALKPSTPVSASADGGQFSEIALAAETGPGLEPLRISYNSSPVPVPSDVMTATPTVVTPPAEPPTAKASSFFSLSFGTPSVTAATPLAPSRSASGGTPAGGWRSTMSNLLTRSTSSAPSEPTSAGPESAGPSRIPSPSLLLHHINDDLAIRDRRQSRELGGGDKIREGFERVRGEMEGVAREMRRENAAAATAEESEESAEGGASPTRTEEVDWVFWGAVVQDFEEVARERPRDLSKAIQQGIPGVIRGSIWQLMSSSKSIPLEETYKQLLKHTSPHEKSIRKDLSRTFPHHKFFQDAGGRESLFMVLKAYSLYDPEVGYTQGVAFIVAALLLNMPDEEAFCVLVRLMDSYNLRSHYQADMPGLQLRLFQYDRLLEEHVPLVHTHLLRKGIKSSMYASQWFMTLFSYKFPLSLVYRVLDIVFAEGIEAVFRFSLALLQAAETKLVELDFEQILEYLQTDLFEHYRENATEDGEESWRANDFVRDAYEIRITPFMLDSYTAEFEEERRNQNKHAAEVDQLRNANRHLSNQVKQLESTLATINEEHVELVRQLVMTKIDKEETENELVRYKMMYAELAHSQQDAMSVHSRRSAGSSRHD